MKIQLNIAFITRLGVFLLGCALSQGASALYVEMFGVSDWGGGNCASSANNRGDWPGMAQAWYDRMGLYGDYKAGKWVNGNFTKAHFCDPQANASCRDYDSASGYGVDWADAAILAVHGADAGPYWAGLMRNKWSVDNDCWIRGGNSGEMRLGDSWIEFMHLSSCLSADQDDLPRIRNAMEDPSTSTTRRAHQWDGFHGCMWIWSGYNGNYSKTADDGHVTSVANAWTWNHYKHNSVGCEAYDPFNWFGTCNDQCPVAYTTGTSANDALARLHNERYNYTYSDPGNINWYAYQYYPHCKPECTGQWQ